MSVYLYSRYKPTGLLVDQICDLVCGCLIGPEQQIMEMRLGKYGKPMDLTAIGETLGITKQAVKQLQDQAFLRILTACKRARLAETVAESKTSIVQLGLPSRTENALRAQGINTIEHLTRFSRYEVAFFPGIGHRAIMHVAAALKKRGLWFSQDRGMRRRHALLGRTRVTGRWSPRPVRGVLVPPDAFVKIKPLDGLNTPYVPRGDRFPFFGSGFVKR